MKNTSIRKLGDEDYTELEHLLTEYWGAPRVVSKGKIREARELDGYIAVKGSVVTGLVTFIVENDECELITLNSFHRRKGLGTQLVKKVITHAKMKGCKRVFLCTTNDNTEALTFYQRRKFVFKDIYVNRIADYRPLKPEIPKTGNHGIPIRDEIEMELVL